MVENNPLGLSIYVKNMVVKNKLIILLIPFLFISCQEHNKTIVNKQNCVVDSVEKIERSFNNIPSEPMYKIKVCDSMTLISNRLVKVGDTVEVEIIKIR
jgi:hypothetical protein